MVFTIEHRLEGPCLRLHSALDVVLLVPDVGTSPLTAHFAFLSSCCSSPLRTTWSHPDEGALVPLQVTCVTCGEIDGRSKNAVPPSVIFRRDDFDSDWSVLDFSHLEDMVDEYWDVLTSELYLSDLRAALQSILSYTSRVLEASDWAFDKDTLDAATAAALVGSRSRWMD